MRTKSPKTSNEIQLIFVASHGTKQVDDKIQLKRGRDSDADSNEFDDKLIGTFFTRFSLFFEVVVVVDVEWSHTLTCAQLWQLESQLHSRLRPKFLSFSEYFILRRVENILKHTFRCFRPYICNASFSENARWHSFDLQTPTRLYRTHTHSHARLSSRRLNVECMSTILHDWKTTCSRTRNRRTNRSKYFELVIASTT